MRAATIATIVIAIASCDELAFAATYDGAMAGANEVPPTVTGASGHVSIVQGSPSSLVVALDFTGLGGNAVAAHIHCCISSPGTNIGVAVPMPGFPAAASGSYGNTFNLDDAATYSSAFLNANGGNAANAKAALLAGMDSDRSYFNIHTVNFPGGEIRANLESAIFHDGFDS
jgi:hypothetical protein